jgi:mannose-6-phosphate isomerase-like protein (cupin superfamily)
MEMNKRINLKEKFSLFNDLWTPKILDEFNGQQLKIAKIKGQFVWHDHADEDELFLVIKGTLYIEFREGSIQLNEGEFFVVPKGVEHRPYAEEECHLLLIEPGTTKHTGTVDHALTVNDQDWI